MTTINTLISDALIDLGKLSPSETMDGSDLAHGLRVVNRLFALFAADNLMIPYTTTESFSMVAGTASYTMGSGGTASSSRALHLIDNCYIVDSGNQSYPVKLIGQDQYNKIMDKTTQGLPEVLFYDPLYPTSYIYYYLVPGSTYTAYIESVKTLHSTFADGTTISLSPEYEEPVILQIRNRLARSFGIPVDGDMRREAYDAMNVLKRLNFVNRSQMMQMPPEFGGPVRLGNINTG